MRYFRYGYRSLEEFQREVLFDGPDLSPDELELLHEIELEHDPWDERRIMRSRRWE